MSLIQAICQGLTLLPRLMKFPLFHHVCKFPFDAFPFFLAVRVRDSLRGMMMKTVRSEQTIDFENNVRSESQLRRASNPEPWNESADYFDAAGESSKRSSVIN